MTKSRCYLCGNCELEEFPGFGERSLTTDGKLVPLAARNAQCRNCGLMQKLQPVERIFEHLSYSETYDLYSRPGVKKFDEARYRSYAQWVGAYLPQAPARIIEIGCGAGWVLAFLQEAYPQHRFEGLEPAASACKAAQANGVQARQGILGEVGSALEPGCFDIAYSINVLEHTPDPIHFLREMVAIVRPRGSILTICPNSDVISSESLYIDHLFSIRRDNLRAMYYRAGLRPSHDVPGAGAMEDLQMMVGTEDGVAESEQEHSVPEALLQARRNYYGAWNGFDDMLIERIGSAENVICFGAGETSDLMSFFAPKAWARVQGYAIDRFNDDKPGQYRDLPLYFIEEVPKTATLVLGTKQHYQPQLYQRLRQQFRHVVRWDDVLLGE
jgi:SAM-dependent methyltransferase